MPLPVSSKYRQNSVTNDSSFAHRGSGKNMGSNRGSERERTHGGQESPAVYGNHSPSNLLAKRNSTVGHSSNPPVLKQKQYNSTTKLNCRVSELNERTPKENQRKSNRHNTIDIQPIPSIPARTSSNQYQAHKNPNSPTRSQVGRTHSASPGLQKVQSLMMNPSQAKERRDSYQTTNSKENDLDQIDYQKSRSRDPDDQGNNESEEHSENDHYDRDHNIQYQVTHDQYVQELHNQQIENGAYQSEGDNLDVIQIGGSAAKMTEQSQVTPSSKHRDQRRGASLHGLPKSTGISKLVMDKSGQVQETQGQAIDHGHVNEIRRKIEQWSSITANSNFTSRGVDLGKIIPNGPEYETRENQRSLELNQNHMNKETAIPSNCNNSPINYNNNYSNQAFQPNQQSHVLPFERSSQNDRDYDRVPRDEERQNLEYEVEVTRQSSRSKRISSSKENSNVRPNSNSKSPSPQQLSQPGVQSVGHTSSTYQSKNGGYYWFLNCSNLPKNAIEESKQAFAISRFEPSPLMLPTKPLPLQTRSNNPPIPENPILVKTVSTPNHPILPSILLISTTPT